MRTLLPIHLRAEFPQLAMRLLWLIIVTIGMPGYPASATSAEIPYLTDLEAARKLAAEQNKIVILYTGRAQFCENRHPKDYFFETVMNGHPKLAARANRYVVCEQFYYADMYGPDGRVSKQMREESERFEELYERYDLRLLSPTVTFLNPNGELLNGPFSTRKALNDPRFSSIERDCYETLTDYANADQPRTLREAQADLAAVAIRPPGEPLDFGIFQYRHHPEGGQKVLLLDTGLPSDQYELLNAVSYTVRDAAANIIPTTKMALNCDIHATGSLRNGLSLKGHVLIRLNGAYFRATISPTYDYTGAGSVKFKPNEHHVWVQVRQRQIADDLVRGFRQLQDKVPDGKIADTQSSKRMVSEEFDRQLCEKIGAVLGFPADRLIVKDRTAEARENFRYPPARLVSVVSTDKTFLPLRLTLGWKNELWRQWVISNSKADTRVKNLTGGHLGFVTLPNGSSAANRHEIIARISRKQMEVGIRLSLPKKLPSSVSESPETQAYVKLISGPREELSQRLEKCLEVLIEAVEDGSFEAPVSLRQF